VFALETLVTPTAQGIASRVIARTAAGNLTLLAFDAREELSEHTAPFDAHVVTLSGALILDHRWAGRRDDAAVSRADAGEHTAWCSCDRAVSHVAHHAARTRTGTEIDGTLAASSVRSTLTHFS
jgi:hypothetical protein